MKKRRPSQAPYAETQPQRAATLEQGSKKITGRAPIRPDHVRSIAGEGFAFVPNRFLREGFFASLFPDELRLYFFLVLTGDRNGLSFCHYDSICSILEFVLDDHIAARNGLIAKDLIAYDGTRFQVLALPATPKPRETGVARAEQHPTNTTPEALATRAQIFAALRPTSQSENQMMYSKHLDPDASSGYLFDQTFRTSLSL